MTWKLFAEILLCQPVLSGSVLSLLSVVAASKIMRTPLLKPSRSPEGVTILKPCYGLELGLEENLRSFCTQRYNAPVQILFCVQKPDDAALPILNTLAMEFPDRVTVIVTPSPPVVNGKVQNMIGGIAQARHDLIIITDSDVRVGPDYASIMTAAFADNTTGYVCSLYRIVDAQTLAEKLEALSFNADFVPQILFTSWSKIAPFCLGASMAFRKSDLDAVGGMQAMLPYLVEDYEIGKRIRALGKRAVLVPHVVDMRIALPHFSDWWQHQVYWDMNTKAANFSGFVASILTRAVPFSVLLAVVRGGDNCAASVLIATVLIRSVCAQLAMARIGDIELGALWLLPFRDCLALGTWTWALLSRYYIWRGIKFKIRPDGTIIPRDGADTASHGQDKPA